MTLKADDYNFDLPQELIAQRPADQREGSRLMLLVGNRPPEHRQFGELHRLLREGDILVANDSRVLPARIRGVKRDGEAKVEALLLNDLGDGRWTALIKPGRRLPVETKIDFRGGLVGEVLARLDNGQVVLGLAAAQPLLELLDEFGEAPLPPYIKRESGADATDSRRYQTVYARRSGSVAAPTAGLHFSLNLLERLKALGIEWLTTTLHVGYGTFAPLPEGELANHQLHTESFSLGKATARKLNEARLEGRRIIAVGTTTARVLESIADARGLVKASHGNTDLFIHPPYRFKAIDGLITNFHLPRSSLLMLVAALIGKDRLLSAYADAVREEYRFFSYGDAMLCLPHG